MAALIDKTHITDANTCNFITDILIILDKAYNGRYIKARIDENQETIWNTREALADLDMLFDIMEDAGDVNQINLDYIIDAQYNEFIAGVVSNTTAKKFIETINQIYVKYDRTSLSVLDLYSVLCIECYRDHGGVAMVYLNKLANKFPVLLPTAINACKLIVDQTILGKVPPFLFRRFAAIFGLIISDFNYDPKIRKLITNSFRKPSNVPIIMREHAYTRRRPALYAKNAGVFNRNRNTTGASAEASAGASAEASAGASTEASAGAGAKGGNRKRRRSRGKRT